MVSLHIDPGVVEEILTFARRLAARGYVHNQLGNIAVRVPHPDYAHGVIYTKHAGVSLEDATADNLVVTDVPTDALIYGDRPTSIGHQLNREILRLRPDIGAVIHVHHDETIALFASGAVKELRVLSLEFPYVMAKPPYVVASHLDVVLDVGRVAGFIQGNISVVLDRNSRCALGPKD